MANFTAAGRLKNLPDIQKNYLFEIFIPSIGSLEQDDFILRVRTATIPGRTVTPIESFFMGTKIYTPGRTEYPEVTVNVEEFEDQKAHAAISSWQQTIFDYDGNSSTAGQQKVATRSEYTRDIVLRTYKANGVKMDKDIVMYSSWPTAIGDATLDYAGGDSVKYDITFRCDYWLPR